MGLYLEEACIFTGERRSVRKGVLIAKHPTRRRPLRVMCPLAPRLTPRSAVCDGFSSQSMNDTALALHFCENLFEEFEIDKLAYRHLALELCLLANLLDFSLHSILRNDAISSESF
jgi:hypothetical protein